MSLTFFEVVHACDPVLIKLGCAVLAGAVLGLEREYDGHAAGLRTTILVCVAPTLAMLACDARLLDDASLSRVTQGLFAGVGFIGGGVILKHGETVRGVTTASILWIATMLGFAFGLGHYMLGFIGLGASFFVIYMLYPFTRLFHTRRHTTFEVTVDAGALTAARAVEILRGLNINASVGAFEFNTAAGTHTYRFPVAYRTSEAHELPARVDGAFAGIPGILHIRWN